MLNKFYGDTPGTSSSKNSTPVRECLKPSLLTFAHKGRFIGRNTMYSLPICIEAINTATPHLPTYTMLSALKVAYALLGIDAS